MADAVSIGKSGGRREFKADRHPFDPSLLHLLEVSEINKIKLWHAATILCGFVESVGQTKTIHEIASVRR